MARRLYALAPVGYAPGHEIRRELVSVEDDFGAPRYLARLHCSGCGRTKLIPFGAHPPGPVGADWLTFAQAGSLHAAPCGCGA